MFRQEPQVSFKHVYLNSDKRGAGVENDARNMLPILSAVGPDADPESFSDPNMLPKEFSLSYARDIEKGKKNEGDLFGGAVIRMGKDLGVPTPTTFTIYKK